MPSAIKIENLSKRYKLGLTHAGSIRELANRTASRLFGRRSKNSSDSIVADSDADRVEDGHFWALKDVSFEVQPGEVVGIIGKNGAGKSTLLKILSQITRPTSGRAVLHGRVASLLEVGTGFHPELTGRENVYLNGTILGMTKREIDQRFDAIVDFSGVEKFIDTPVKRYSSGMMVRLGFAVAAHMEPEILIVDEVLAVGDLEFQYRCLGKMRDVAESGKTVIFVSHNITAVRQLTARSVVLVNGTVGYVGSTESALQHYIGTMGSPAFSGNLMTFERTMTDLTGDIKFVEVSPMRFDGNLRFSITLNVQSKCRSPILGLSVYREDETPVGTAFSSPLTLRPHPLDQTIELRLESTGLAPGKYNCSLTIRECERAVIHDSVAGILDFEVSDEIMLKHIPSATWASGWGSVMFRQLDWTSSGKMESMTVRN
jgi:homopolymeric O-antigen transport system ATP-binding protein